VRRLLDAITAGSFDNYLTMIVGRCNARTTALKDGVQPSTVKVGDTYRVYQPGSARDGLVVRTMRLLPASGPGRLDVWVCEIMDTTDSGYSAAQVGNQAKVRAERFRVI